MKIPMLTETRINIFSIIKNKTGTDTEKYSTILNLAINRHPKMCTEAIFHEIANDPIIELKLCLPEHKF